MSSFSYYLGILKKKKDNTKIKSFRDYRNELFGRVRGEPITDVRWADENYPVFERKEKEPEDEKITYEWVFGEYPRTPKLQADEIKKMKDGLMIDLMGSTHIPVHTEEQPMIEGPVEELPFVAENPDALLKERYIDNYMRTVDDFIDRIKISTAREDGEDEDDEDEDTNIQINIQKGEIASIMGSLYDSQDDYAYYRIVMDLMKANLELVALAAEKYEPGSMEPTLKSMIEHGSEYRVGDVLKTYNDARNSAREIVNKEIKELNEKLGKINKEDNRDEWEEVTDRIYNKKLERRDMTTLEYIWKEEGSEKGTPTVESEDDEVFDATDEEVRAVIEREQSKKEPSEEGPINLLINPELYGNQQQ